MINHVNTLALTHVACVIASLALLNGCGKTEPLNYTVDATAMTQTTVLRPNYYGNSGTAQGVTVNGVLQPYEYSYHQSDAAVTVFIGDASAAIDGGVTQLLIYNDVVIPAGSTVQISIGLTDKGTASADILPANSSGAQSTACSGAGGSVRFGSGAKLTLTQPNSSAFNCAITSN